jgi:hypothetical protein
MSDVESRNVAVVLTLPGSGLVFCKGKVAHSECVQGRILPLASLPGVTSLDGQRSPFNRVSASEEAKGKT